MDNVKPLLEAGARGICIDIAHGHSLTMMNLIRDDLAAVGIKQEIFSSERAMVDSGGIERCLEARLGRVQAVDRRFVFPLRQMLVQSFNPDPRVLLIGDAARVLHPLAGLGANIGFEDVRDLLEDLAAMPAGQDPGAAHLWGKFARQRRARSQIMLSLMTGFRRVYAASDPLSQWLRNSGVDWLNQAGILKSQLIKEALGLGPVARRW